MYLYEVFGINYYYSDGITFNLTLDEAGPESKRATDLTLKTLTSMATLQSLILPIIYLITPHKTIPRTLTEFASLVTALSQSHPYLIPPASPPPECKDVDLVRRTITGLLEWIAGTAAVLDGEGWKTFVGSEFGFQPVIKPWIKSGSVVAGWWGKGVEEVDIGFEQIRGMMFKP